jgi:hypothetical protein
MRKRRGKMTIMMNLQLIIIVHNRQIKMKKEEGGMSPKHPN